MFQSRIVEVAGVFAGAAVTAAGKFRFVAVDPRVEDLDGSEWPSFAEVERVVGRLLQRNGHLPGGPASADALPQFRPGV